MSKLDVPAMIAVVEGLLAASELELAIKKLLNLVETLNAERESLAASAA